MQKLRNANPHTKPLTHSSFWLSEWAIWYIKRTAARSHISQSTLINAIMLDRYLNSIPLNLRNSPEYKQSRRWCDGILSMIQ